MQGRCAPILDVEAHLDVSCPREAESERTDARKAAVSLAHGTRHVARGVEVVPRDLDVERDQRRPRSNQDTARLLVELHRAEIRHELPGVPAPPPREGERGAPPPSFTPGELPAVCEPWSPLSGLSFASVSSDESRRGPSSTSTTVSPFLPLTVTGTISSGRRPSSVALIASSWLGSAQRSMSGRVSSSSSATSPASSNICLPLNGLRRPSLIIASIALASPMRKPKRACLSRYGAWLIDSIPPPTPTSRSPARIAASRMPAARTPEAHTLLTVSEETSFGMPALICAWREGIWPWPAWRTCPMTTCWTCSGSTPARSSAALIAMLPSSVASSDESPPPILPMGVRAAPRMTVWGMAFGVLRVGEEGNVEG